MDGAIYTATAQQRRVRGIDDGVNIELGDVGLEGAKVGYEVPPKVGNTCGAMPVGYCVLWVDFERNEIQKSGFLTFNTCKALIMFLICASALYFLSM